MCVQIITHAPICGDGTELRVGLFHKRAKSISMCQEVFLAHMNSWIQWFFTNYSEADYHARADRQILVHLKFTGVRAPISNM